VVLKKEQLVKLLPFFTKRTQRLLKVSVQKHRHVKPSQLNPRGGSKDIHVATPLHKLALVVDEKTSKTSRIGYQKNADGVKVRLARQAKNKEIK
jgi:large subunit ribosomal protein L24